MEMRKWQKNALMYHQGKQHRIVFRTRQSLVRIHYACPLLD